MPDDFTGSGTHARSSPEQQRGFIPRPAYAGFFMAKIYLVNIPVDEYTSLCGEIRAKSIDHAEKIAAERGYEFLGELVDTEPCHDIVEAMIQRHHSVVH